MRKTIFALFFLLLPLPAFSAPNEDILVHNRILATINGKNITVIDVMKKMDVYLDRAHPEWASNPQNRFQFFSSNWKQTLSQIIDHLLILADAENLEIKITDGEVREKIHERYGPNVMASIDKLNLTLEEAWEMIYQEIAVQKMSGYRVYAKAMHSTGPQDIKIAYEEHLAKNPPKEEWKYQVISIRAATENIGSLYAQRAYTLIKGEEITFEELAQKLKETAKKDEGISVSVSDEYNVEGKNLSNAHKTVLTSLAPNSYSQPVSQVSRRDKTTVHRIFYLKEYTVTPPPSFDSMVEDLHDRLVQKEIHKEFPRYISRLRKQFNIQEDPISQLPPNFQPFTLR